MPVKHKVSSVLNGLREFSGKNMFDETAIDKCWNSDQGCPQYILMDFGKTVSVSSIAIMFQGGFVGQEGRAEIGDSVDSLMLVSSTLDHDLMDTNDEQRFDVGVGEDGFLPKGRYLRILFDSSTDFYGRVTIYSLKIFGGIGCDETYL